MIGNGVALKADYFSSALHELRKRGEFSNYFREHTITDGDLRDINAVERLTSGYLKRLFPDLNPARGHEQAGLRPVLILSHEIFNERSGTVIAVAITSQPQRAGFPLTLEW